MRNKLSRRKFLKGGVAGSAAIGCGVLARPRMARPDPWLPAAASRTSLNPQERRLLRATMDEIIPESDGMPSAGQVGGVEYLERLARENPGIAAQITGGLEGLEAIATARFQKSFVSLPRSERVEALAQLEKSHAALFAGLRDYIYEAYYTQPRVWKLIGYDFYPTNSAGPHMKPFDEAALAEVRKKPKYYREA